MCVGWNANGRKWSPRARSHLKQAQCARSSGARSPRLSVQALFEHIHEGERFSLFFFLNAIFGNTWNAETAALITGTNTRVMWERQVRDTWGTAWARRQNGGRLKKTRSSLSLSRARSLLLPRGFFLLLLRRWPEDTSALAIKYTAFCLLISNRFPPWGWYLQKALCIRRSELGSPPPPLCAVLTSPCWAPWRVSLTYSSASVKRVYRVDAVNKIWRGMLWCGFLHCFMDVTFQNELFRRCALENGVWAMRTVLMFSRVFQRMAGKLRSARCGYLICLNRPQFNTEGSTMSFWTK